jgi:tripartite-type tricarboxylate transporter receptor subunit TctC
MSCKRRREINHNYLFLLKNMKPLQGAGCAGAALMMALSVAATAQDYPNRPLRWVLGFAPGGSPDSVARIITPQLTAQLGQSVVLDNRPGANGILAADIVAKSAPDGYTLLITPAAFAINPGIARKLPFDAIRSFEPITNICISEALVLAVTPALAANTVQDLIQLAKRPGSKIAYGTSGVGNVTHLAAALFALRTGALLTHVPYKGGGPMSVALIGGEVQMAFSNLGTLIGQVRSGRIRVLAYNAPQRSTLLPNVPTMIEAGVAGMELDSSWYGVFAPAKTPAAIVNRLHNEIRNALKAPPVRDGLAVIGMEPVGNSPAEFKAFVERAIKRYAELVKLAGIERE